MGKSFLYTNDGILVKVPNEVITKSLDLKEVINSINLSSNRVDIKLYNNFLTPKQINVVLLFCLVLLVLNFSKYFSYSNEISKIDEKIENLKKINNLPTSMIQIDSIISSNKKISQKEIEKREAIFYVLSNKDFEVKNIELQNDVLSIDFLNVDKEKIIQHVSNKYKIISNNTQDLILNIKVQI